MSLTVLSNKKIYLTKEFLSYSSSILHLPIFTSLHSKNDNSKFYTLELERYWGFDDVAITSPWLSIKYDFKVFSYILRVFYKNHLKGVDPYSIDFSIDDFVAECSGKNNKFYLVEQIKSSLEKLSKINILFTKENKRYLCRVLDAGNGGVLYDKKQTAGIIKLKIDENFINFFKHDPDLILNINHEELDSIDGDYAKVLYTFYKTNQQARTFEKEVIIQRLKPDANKEYYRKVFDGIKTAHKSLINCGFIKEVKYKKQYNNKEVSHFEIIFNDNFMIKETRKEEEIKKREDEIKKKEEESKKKRPNLFEKNKDQEDEEPKDDPIPF